MLPPLPPSGQGPPPSSRTKDGYSPLGASIFEKRGLPCWSFFPSPFLHHFKSLFSNKNDTKTIHLSCHCSLCFPACCWSRFLSHFYHKSYRTFSWVDNSDFRCLLKTSWFYHINSMPPFLGDLPFSVCRNICSRQNQ